MKERKTITKWLYWFTFAVVVIFIYKIIDNFTNIFSWSGKLISVLMPFFMGILIAYLFYIPCREIEKLYKKIKPKFYNKRARGLSIVTVYIMALLVIIIVINILIPALSKSIIELANNLPGYYKAAVDLVNEMPEDGLIKKESALEIINDLQKTDIVSIISVDNLMDYVKGVLGVASAIFNIFVAFIMSVYILLERREILKFIKRLLSAI